MHRSSSVNIHILKGAVNRRFNIKKTANFNYTTFCIRVHFLWLMNQSFRTAGDTTIKRAVIRTGDCYNQISLNTAQHQATEMICKGASITKFKPDRTATCNTRYCHQEQCFTRRLIMQYRPRRTFKCAHILPLFTNTWKHIRRGMEEREREMLEQRPGTA